MTLGLLGEVNFDCVCNGLLGWAPLRGAGIGAGLWVDTSGYLQLHFDFQDWQAVHQLPEGGALLP